jgi:hypothetical protein
MSNSTFPLSNLPFDVLHQVIEILDHGDIHSLCQVSRGFDAIGAPILYRILKWDEDAGFLYLEEGFVYVCFWLFVLRAEPTPKLEAVSSVSTSPSPSQLCPGRDIMF